MGQGNIRGAFIEIELVVNECAAKKRAEMSETSARNTQKNAKSNSTSKQFIIIDFIHYHNSSINNSLTENSNVLIHL
jgi:hypothetical protein